MVSAPNLLSVFLALRFVLYLLCGYATILAVKKLSALELARVKTWLFWALVSSALLQSALVGYQFLSGHALGVGFLGESAVSVGQYNASSVYLGTGTFLRGYGTFPHPNVAAFFIALAVLLCVNELLAVGLRRKWFVLFPLILLLVGLLLTWSRVAVFSCAVGIVLMTVMHFGKKNKKLFAGFVAGLICVICAMIIWVFAGQGHLATAVRERFVAQSISTDVSVVERRELASRAWEMIKDHPFWGVGVGRFIPSLSKNPVYQSSGVRVMQPVHNTFMLILAEIGVLGVLLLAVPVFLLVKQVKLSSFTLSVLFLIIGISLSDHFLWSLPQGIVLAVIIIPLLVVDQTILRSRA